ncbi:MAG: acyl-CoA thioesterase [Candidatus Sericytochromatia bacterium]|nr:acyl-CoA thioesterase [Candidatus Tanganyikabacteria bacterium]
MTDVPLSPPWPVEPSIRVLLLPKDTNEHGTIFGGVILSHLDLAAAVEAGRHTEHRFVTVALREVKFEQPVHVGDTVSFYTRLEGKGQTSLTIGIRVEARRRGPSAESVLVTTAEAVFVTVGADGKPVAWDSPLPVS